MKVGKGIACLLFSTCLFGIAHGQQTQARADVHWCSTIPSFRFFQEARFAAVYTFDINAKGSPTNIRRANVPFISKADRPLIDCIASWRLGPRITKGTAVFNFYWGWKDLDVSAGGIKVNVPAGASSPQSY